MKNVFRFFSFLVLAGAVVGGVILVQKNQETRKGAAAIVPELIFQPSGTNFGVGATFYVNVAVDTKANSMKLAAFEIAMKYDPAKLKIEEVVPNWFIWDKTNVYGKDASFFKKLEGDDPYDMSKPSDILGKNIIDNVAGKLTFSGISSLS